MRLFYLFRSLYHNYWFEAYSLLVYWCCIVSSILLTDNFRDNIFLTLDLQDLQKTYKVVCVDHESMSCLYHLLGSLLYKSYLNYYFVCIHLVNIINDVMKRARAKRAVIIVQQQSVHFLFLYSIGKFLKVNTLSR